RRAREIESDCVLPESACEGKSPSRNSDSTRTAHHKRRRARPGVAFLQSAFPCRTFANFGHGAIQETQRRQETMQPLHRSSECSDSCRWMDNGTRGPTAQTVTRRCVEGAVHPMTA